MNAPLVNPHSRRTMAPLRIMQTTDLHMNLLAYDYYADRPANDLGLIRTASLIRKARREVSNTLLFDNGDIIQGGPMGDYVALVQGVESGTLHPAFAAMNHLGYDAATLGNHDFDYGIDFLMRSLQGAAFPVVCANVAMDLGPEPRLDQTLLPPFALLDRVVCDAQGQQHPIRIGVIGAVPPQSTISNRGPSAGRIATRSIPDTIRDYLPLIRAEKADIVIALCHSGIIDHDGSSKTDNAGLQVAALEGIDVVLCGHTHLVFPGDTAMNRPGIDAQRGTLHGKPAVMAGTNGSHLGLVDLQLQHQDGQWKVASHATQIRPIATHNDHHRTVALVGDDPDLGREMAGLHRNTLEYMRRPVGQSVHAIHSFFAQVSNERSLQTVMAAQRWYAEQQFPPGGLPLLSASAPFKCGGRGGPDNYSFLPAGPLAISNIADLYIYPNHLCHIRLKGSDLRAWLEYSASAFCPLHPGKTDQWLLDPDFPPYYFDVIEGLRYSIDLSQPPRYHVSGTLRHPSAQRIRNLRHKGEPVDDEAEFLVVTNSYRARNLEKFCPTASPAVAFSSQSDARRILSRFIAQGGIQSTPLQEIWRFTPMPATTALFYSAPEATNHLGDHRGPRITAAGSGKEGFARYRLHL